MGDTVGEEGIGTDVRPGTVVYVIGSLGDVVKKLIETNLRVADKSEDHGALIEYAALGKLIEHWPVLNDFKADLLIRAMSSSATRYKAVEKEMDEVMAQDYKEVNPFALRNLVGEMIQRRNEIRFQIAELNKLSMGIGKASAVPFDSGVVISRLGE